MTVRSLRSTKVVAMGQSHLAALVRGYGSRGYEKPFECSFVLLGREEFQPQIRNGELNPRIAAAASATSPDVLVLAVTGNEHNVLGIVNHPQRFDFVLPGRCDLPLDETAQLLPFGLIRSWFTERLEMLAFPLLRQLRKLSGVPIFVLEPPPPIPSADHIAAHAEDVFKALHERGVAPIAFRYKLWRAQAMQLKGFCDELGIEFISVPLATQDSDGMLAKPYWGNDATHANGLYGQLVLDVVAERLVATETAMAHPVDSSAP